MDSSEEKIRELSKALLRATDEEEVRTRGEELRVAIRVHLKRLHDQLKIMAASSRSQR